MKADDEGAEDEGAEDEGAAEEVVPLLEAPPPGTEPPGHSLHEEEPEPDEYAVTGHAKHDVDPGRLLKDPG